MDRKYQAEPPGGTAVTDKHRTTERNQPKAKSSVIQLVSSITCLLGALATDPFRQGLAVFVFAVLEALSIDGAPT